MTTTPRCNPFDAPGIWLKGAVHVHTTNSDGSAAPADACAFYAARGYDFVCFGDHWHVTMPEESHGLLLIPGCEIDTWRDDEAGNTHIMCMGADSAPPRPPDSAPRMGQRELWALAQATGEYCVFAHPYWSTASPDRIARLPGLYAIEVYNHGTERTIAQGHAEFVWDLLLNAGHRIDALAVDDAHWHQGTDDAGGGFVMVKAAARTRQAIMAALRAGSFYSSMGPRIDAVEISGTTFAVRTSPAAAVVFRGSQFYGSVVRGTPETPVTHASYTADPQRTRHIRIQVEDQHGCRAWSNPFYL